MPDADEGEAVDSTTGRTSPARRWYLLIGLGIVAAILVTALARWNRGGSPVEPAAFPNRLGRLLARSTSEGRSIREIRLGATIGDVALVPGTSRVLVAFLDAPAAGLVDLSTGGVVDRYPLGEPPSVLVVARDGQTLYAGGPQNVSIVNLRTREARSVPAGGSVRSLALSADGQRLWIALAQAGMKVLDLRSLRVESRPVIGCPMYFANDPGRGRLFVSYQCEGPGGHEGHDAIEIIDDASRRSVIARSGPPLVGHKMTVSPDGLFLWADAGDACAAPQYDHVGCPPGRGAVLYAFSTSTLERVASVRLPSETYQSMPLFFPDGSRLVARLEGLHVLNAALGHVEEHIDLPDTGACLFTDDRRRLVLADFGRRELLDFPLDDHPDARSLDGLSSYWPGDGTANDLAGGTHAITDGHAIRYAPGRLGQAFAFSGEGADISFGTRFDVDPLQQSVTLAAWIKPRPKGAAMAILDRAGPVGWRWWIDANGHPAFCIASTTGAASCDRGGVTGSETVAPSIWSHVGVVRSPDAVTLYLNARAIGTVSLRGYQPPSRASYDDRRITRLGAAGAGRLGFDGLIDEVAVFRRVLSAEEFVRLETLTTLQGR